jgi:tRNA(adenine34) deaminase
LQAILDDEYWMRIALGEAEQAATHADVPVGCVVVSKEGVELGRGHNRREVSADPTAHAEVLALRQAAKSLGCWRLNQTSVYVTLEPCVMCAGAMVNARIGRLVYAASDPKAGAIDSLFTLGRDRRLNHRFDVASGLCSESAVFQLRVFFAKLRTAGEK